MFKNMKKHYLKTAKTVKTNSIQNSIHSVISKYPVKILKK